MRTTITPGDLAPNFTLSDQNGSPVNLAKVLASHKVVLYFYPRDNTPGCTLEAKSFRDHYEAFSEVGAQVIGVSSDSVDSHCAFHNKHALPFLLLSDPGGAVAKEYGIRPSLGFIPGRETFIIDQSQHIVHMFRSQFNAKQHVAEALNVLTA